MIPKIIHYCRFGRAGKSRLARRCMNSWKEYFPAYEIREWNEDNFDLSMNPYVRYMYQNKKYAFLCDYIRLWVVYTYGGIYFDLDVEVIKSFDDIIRKGAFLGMEGDRYVATGLGFGAEKNNEIVGYMLERYDRMAETEFEKPVNCPILNTETLIEHGLIRDGRVMNDDRITIYPKDYFAPFDNNTASMKYLTERTHSIHWYAKTWMTKKEVLISSITAPFHRVFGDDCFRLLKKITGHGMES